MEIMAASAEKVGDLFLHAGYLSAAGGLTDSDITFVLIGLPLIVASLFLFDALNLSPRAKLVLLVALGAALWLAGCDRIDTG